MTRKITLILVLLSAVSVASAQRRTTTEEILKLDASRFAAMTRGDLDELRRILADDLTYTHSTGVTETKQEFLAGIESGNLKYQSIESGEAKARIYGTVAVINGRANVKVNSRGQEQSFSIRYIDVYVRRNGKWQMVAWQSSRLP